MNYGFTTGSCSAAAAKAAAYMLLTGKEKTEITIQTPKAIDFTTQLHEITRSEKSVSCAVKKNAGDDPDITNGALVFAKVTTEIPDKFWENEKLCKMEENVAVPEKECKFRNDIFIDGGIGVGRVTKPGLDQPVGEAAINHVPREMITKEVREICELTDYKGSLYVEISIPEGVELAKQTFNPRLGIVGGISVLGTSGIVEPMSAKALLDTIRVELNVKKAAGYSMIAISPGNYGMDFMKRTYQYDLDKSVKCSNFIGDTIDMACELGFEKLLLLGHIGKLVKLAGGIMNTHSKEGDCRMEILTAACVKAGMSGTVLAEVLDSVTTEEAIRIINKEEMLEPVMDYIMKQAMFYLNKRAADRIAIELVMYTNDYGELAKSEHAAEYIEEIKRMGDK